MAPYLATQGIDMAASTFLEIVLRSDEFTFDGRDEIEDPLDEALADSSLGEVTGGGSGIEGSNIDVEVSDLSRGLGLVKRVLRELNVGPSTVVNQYEPRKIVHQVYD